MMGYGLRVVLMVVNIFFPLKLLLKYKKNWANIIMAFDSITHPCDYSYTNKSMKLTHNWLDRCIKTFKNEDSIYGFDQIFFPIVQGILHIKI